MKTLSRRYLVVVVLMHFSALSTVAGADGSKEFALRGMRAWAAFECSALAEIVGDKKMAEKMFDLGYAEGKVFVEAYIAGKVRREELDSEIPFIMHLALRGPTSDFMLGRVWEIALHNVMKEADLGDGRPRSQEERKEFARREIAKRNCNILFK